MNDFYTDERIVMTLDAGGTNFAFSAIKNGQQITDSIVFPSFATDKEKCLKTIIEGFKRVKDTISPLIPSAISFAFPGPADYKNGIIGDLPNFPSFRGGIALGPMLEHIFQIPTFINNDGDLFTYGEAVAGFLPFINKKLKEKNINKSYSNLIGITLGTGFGAGVVVNTQICQGDNSAAGELWLTQNYFSPNIIAEESVSIRAIQRVYKRDSASNEILDPEDIYLIAKGEKHGNKEAALKAFEEMGTALGGALVNTISLVDAPVVIGGGIAGAAEFIIPKILEHLNGNIADNNGNKYKRVIPEIFYLDNPESYNNFIKNTGVEVEVPFTDKKVIYNEQKKIPIGLSKLGTSEAIWLGAYYLALNNLDKKAFSEKIV
ncbi:ROK family protein [Abyssalbus ytuae]|uniref:ROK family protein n=1 Tax=Abyssalbus ytuae TaxID=2926907 RepID=A0A9E6ZN05_9FLAO|nr:ROK family protein [Abyssalbus ytuae]UOB17280.1 ROK family protein [Abyssalbus ytuae]